MIATRFKQRIYESCLLVLQEKAAACNLLLKELAAGIENDAKSAAGDKHETSRAMMQQEQEKIGWQLKELNAQIEILNYIDINAQTLKAHTGSLIKTDKGYLFLSVAIGRITIDNEHVIVLSPQSPLGIQLLGKTIGNDVEVNTNKYRILEIL